MPKLRNPIVTANAILSCFSTAEAMDILAKAGYQGMEVWADSLDKEIEQGRTSIEDVKAALERNRIGGVIHCPLRDWKSPERKLSICSKDEHWRKKSLELNLKAIDLAHQLGLRIITIHPGHTDEDGETADDEYWQLQIDAFRQLTAHAEKRGVFIGFEPMENRPKEFVTEPEHAQRILHEVGSVNLGITFDLIHAYTHGEDMPIEFLDWMDEQIFHVHVSGHSENKTHVPFHMTEMNHSYLDKVFQKLADKGYDGFISIEGHTRGLCEQTGEHQKEIIEKNLEYIHKEIKALHLE
ncbi:sugar phosphate isomerase/epimerase [Candidatus Woesearchaeota archaeon]|nr:sugar phosphate isomerase/epimerase [Candidatus Woesearchaeota archaeon]